MKEKQMTIDHFNTLPNHGGREEPKGRGDRGLISIFVGSFDPFHEGHKSIVDRALSLFDKVVVGIGVNPEKKYMFSVEERIERIRLFFPDEERITVEAYDDLTIDFAKRHRASYIVKGVRNAEDFVYEQKQAQWNKEHGGIETILLFAEPGLEDISSTKVRKQIRKDNC